MPLSLGAVITFLSICEVAKPNMHSICVMTCHHCDVYVYIKLLFNIITQDTKSSHLQQTDQQTFLNSSGSTISTGSCSDVAVSVGAPKLDTMTHHGRHSCLPTLDQKVVFTPPGQRIETVTDNTLVHHNLGDRHRKINRKSLMKHGL